MAEKLQFIKSGDRFEIVANREGLMGLAEVCLTLARLPENDEEAKKLGNHYHYAAWADNVDQDSLDLTIRYKPDL